MFIQKNDDKSNNKLKFLIIENNKLNQKSISFLLLSLIDELCEIYEAPNVEEAIKLAKTNIFDLILINIDWLEVDTIEIARIIRKEESKNTDTPIIVISWHHLNKNKCIDIKVDFLSIPIDIVELQGLFKKYKFSTKLK